MLKYIELFLFLNNTQGFIQKRQKENFKRSAQYIHILIKYEQHPRIVSYPC